LERGTPPDGGRWGAGLVFLGGLGFLGGCGWLILDAWRNSVLSLSFAVGPVLGALLGLAAVCWQWRSFLLMCRTALPHGEVSPYVVGPGDEFTFQYRQEVWSPLRADVTTSLVLRETITRQLGDDESTERVRDHLVAAHTEKGLELPAGGLLQVRCPFRLPSELREFPVSNWPVQGVVKVHVQVRRGADYWEEFPLPGSLREPAPVRAMEAADAGYQVTLVSYPNLYRGLPPPPPLDEYLPHLVQVDRLPLVLLRGITQMQAEEVCRRLEAAGGVVELSQGGRVIEHSRVHDLPVPAETGRLAPQELPVPASETEGAVPSVAARRTEDGIASEQIRLRLDSRPEIR
jgi:hypothetical protein